MIHSIESFISSSPIIAWIVLVVAFVILAKSADLFVESAVALANKFNIPKLVIGIVLVSFATTAPELAVSLMSAIKGNPEMALGNAIGSVICNGGLALGLAGVLAVGTIRVIPKVLKTSGIFLVVIEIVTFLFVYKDAELSRIEGIILVLLFSVYLVYMFREHKKGNLKDDLETEVDDAVMHKTVATMIMMFIVAIAGILIASEFVVVSATTIARSLHVPEAVIALTLVAFGTSVPEVATCVVSAKKGHGDIAVGNIIGANILNICWVAGASAIANNLVLTHKQIYFMFPCMFVIVLVMLIMLRINYSLTKKKGLILIILYAIYILASVLVFPPEFGNKASTQNHEKQLTNGS